MFRTEEDRERADWPLLSNGPITLFWRAELFDAAKCDLQALGYDLIEANGDDERTFQRAMSDGLLWQTQFSYEPWSGNLNALADSFVALPDEVGDLIAICISRFDLFAARSPGAATGVLDVLAEGARRLLLEGRRLAVLVQTDDPRFFSEGLGAVRANWNLDEWLDHRRGL
jgi:hypothetical protein